MEEESSADAIQSRPSIVPKEGLDDLSFIKALLVSTGGAVLLGAVLSLGAVLLGRTILKKILFRKSASQA